MPQDTRRGRTCQSLRTLRAWLANTTESLAMLLRPGNAGSNTVTGHIEVLAAALKQIPARWRSSLLVRADGAGATHDLIKHLLTLSARRHTDLFTCGWMITAAGGRDPAAARRRVDRRRGPGRYGAEETAVAEITHLTSRAENWPGGLRWIVRHTKPSRRRRRTDRV